MKENARSKNAYHHLADSASKSSTCLVQDPPHDTHTHTHTPHQQIPNPHPKCPKLGSNDRLGSALRVQPRLVRARGLIHCELRAQAPLQPRRTAGPAPAAPPGTRNAASRTRGHQPGLGGTEAPKTRFQEALACRRLRESSGERPAADKYVNESQQGLWGRRGRQRTSSLRLSPSTRAPRPQGGPDRASGLGLRKDPGFRLRSSRKQGRGVCCILRPGPGLRRAADPGPRAQRPGRAGTRDPDDEPKPTGVSEGERAARRRARRAGRGRPGTSASGGGAPRAEERRGAQAETWASPPTASPRPRIVCRPQSHTSSLASQVRPPGRAQARAPRPRKGQRSSSLALPVVSPPPPTPHRVACLRLRARRV
jgi:hypothetical protein